MHDQSRFAAILKYATVSRPNGDSIKDIADISKSLMFCGQNIDMISISAKSISTHLSSLILG